MRSDFLRDDGVLGRAVGEVTGIYYFLHGVDELLQIRRFALVLPVSHILANLWPLREAQHFADRVDFRVEVHWQSPYSARLVHVDIAVFLPLSRFCEVVQRMTFLRGHVVGIPRPSLVQFFLLVSFFRHLVCSDCSQVRIVMCGEFTAVSAAASLIRPLHRKTLVTFSQTFVSFEGRLLQFRC